MRKFLGGVGAYLLLTVAANAQPLSTFDDTHPSVIYSLGNADTQTGSCTQDMNLMITIWIHTTTISLKKAMS